MSQAGARALAVVGAAAAAVAGWAVVGPIAGADLVVEGDNGRTLTVGVGAVIFLGVLAGLGAWALLALLERITIRARVIWLAAAAVALVLGFAPLLGSDASTGTRIGLGALAEPTGPATSFRAYDARDEPEKAS